MLRRSLITPTVLLAIAVLSGCTVGTPVEPSPSVAPTPAAASVYTCDDIAALDDVAPAFVTADGTTPPPVAAIQPAYALTEYAVPALGGLSCSWRVGPAVGNPMQDSVATDWAYVSVKVVPGGADSWAPYAVGDTFSLGDGPSDTAMTIGGIEAAAGCGRDSGCFISAPVGDAWVEIVLSTRWNTLDGGYYSGLTPDAILAQMQPLAASVFTALTDAQPGQLVWPAVDLVERERDCTGALGSQGIAMALGVDSLEYEVRSQSTVGKTYFDNYVSQRSGVFTCSVQVDGVPVDLHAAGLLGTSVTVGYDLAGLVDTMVSTPDSQALPTVALKGAVEGEHAVQICADHTTFCIMLFSLGQSAYQVESNRDTVAIAEAIIAEAR
ncbi:hypothetical protein [Cryobacterium luteum]|uniref:Uncharacterized protein n=1 Tax=Cryobacterium luteum TaxID=1424661 RepID=A0A1H8M9V5_9MICO|nr:hypothetical protein [Cryobacterium luteum]TFB82471.1 hypothetical protein E3O10_17530 [Cryobacterium luteum]SEO14125.1 hypothetical protein SAMN05216281_1416 [Cryobacterium luteum]